MDAGAGYDGSEMAVQPMDMVDMLGQNVDEFEVAVVYVKEVEKENNTVVVFYYLF